MMKNVRSYIMLAVLIIGMMACNTATKDQVAGDAATANLAFDIQKARAFVDSINSKITGQFRSGDSVALASHYWPDAEMLFANSEPIKGKDILAAWGSMVRMGVKDFTFQTTDIALSGDLLVETGSYEMKAADKTLVDRGKYVVVWKQQNGEWKLYRDIGNTSMPAANK